jgi:hypothetical protein
MLWVVIQGKFAALYAVDGDVNAKSTASVLSVAVRLCICAHVYLHDTVGYTS